jgi:hypothetical protein
MPISQALLYYRLGFAIITMKEPQSHGAFLKEGEGCLEEEKYAVARQRIQG